MSGPKKKPGKQSTEVDPDQSRRFRAAVRELLDAGELNPGEAASALDRLVTRSRTQSQDDPEGGCPSCGEPP